MGFIETDDVQGLMRYDATIAAGASESEAIDTKGMKVIGIAFPSAWTAATLGFKVALATTDTHQVLGNISATAINVTAAANNRSELGSSAFRWPSVKLFSHNGSGVAVNQAAARTVTVLLEQDQ